MNPQHVSLFQFGAELLLGQNGESDIDLKVSSEGVKLTRLYFNYYHNPEWKRILKKVHLKSFVLPFRVEINPKTIKMLFQLIKPLTKSTLKYNASLKSH